MWPLVVTGILTLVGFGAAWYYRTMAISNGEVAKAVAAHAQELGAVVIQTQGELTGALKKLHDLDADEAASDNAQAAKVDSAESAANFLRESTRPGSYSACSVPLTRRAKRTTVVTGFGRG